MRRFSTIAAVVAMLWLLTGCSTVLTALLVNELLNDEAPKRTWSGTVRDTTGEPVGGMLVEVRAELQGDDDLLHFSDTTDMDGEYRVGYRWHKDVNYGIRVVHEGVVFAEEQFGNIELKDMETVFIIQGAVSIELAGVVTDWDNNPLEGVLVIGASASSLTGSPSVMLDGDGETRHYITAESGIYTIEGSVARYGIVCAYHPNHGFAYAYGEDDDSDGSIALNIKMGEAGIHDVDVQVVDGLGTPIALQVLPADRQFRLRMSQPWNLGIVVDDVVEQNELFQGLVGDPSDGHPETVTITVQAAGLNGIAENSEQVPGGLYELSLLNVQNDTPATALVNSDNPLALHEDAIVVVRVN
jgi:hypothetical protein